MIKTIKKIFSALSNHGFYVTYRKIKNALLKNNSYHLISGQREQHNTFYLNPNMALPQKMAALPSPPPNGRMVWFVPEFSEGSGGHRTILRHIEYYEKQGLYADVYIFYQNLWGNTERVRKNILKYFDIHLKHCRFYELTLGEVDPQVSEEYSIAMATSWESAYIVANFSKCFKKGYFVQDFEPWFFAKGSLYHFAEATYSFHFDIAITAGDWLKKLMEEQYKIPAVSFGFGYDKTIYYPISKNTHSAQKTIFYYARPITERRGFELAIQVLSILSQKRTDIKIITAGWDLSTYKIPFEYQDFKKTSPEQLAELYRQSDLALVISLTNLSLLPYEVAATGCPVLMNEGPNTEWIDPDKKLFFYCRPTVNDWVTSIEFILDNPEEVEARRKLIFEHLTTISWEGELTKGYTALSKMI